MATSGTTAYAQTAREYITYALRKINILGKSEDATGEQADIALRELNYLVKEWQRYPGIWRLTEGSATPVANTASISLSSLKPRRVIDCRYRNASSIDLPMLELTRQSYYDLPIKTSTGVPTQWYYDPQRDSDTLYIWPVLASVSTDTIRVTYLRRFEAITDLAENVDIAEEHMSTLAMTLAARLADDYGRKGPHIDRIIQRAEMLFQDMLDADRPEVIQFLPGRR